MADGEYQRSARQPFRRWQATLGALLGFSLLFLAAQSVAAESTWQQRHAAAKKLIDPGEQVAILSEGFLGLPYVESPLIGSETQSECLVNDLTRIDCFTLVDFVEALRRSPDLKEFDQQLLKVRYRNGELSFQTRNHFFSAWGEANHPAIFNLTPDIAGGRTVALKKTLNLKQDGELWLEGLPTREIELSYLPTAALDENTQARLKTGDYLGIVTPLAGLDVSHTGILIRKDGTLYLRHASSRLQTRKVLDQPLLPYLQGKLGVLVFRPQ